MNQIKFYKLAIGCLILLNILIVAFFLFRNLGPKPLRGPSKNTFQKEISRTLNLDAEQQLKFDALVEQHEKEILSINKEEQKILIPYFENIGSSTHASDTTALASILSKSQQLQKQKLAVSLQHFTEIKSLLKENQLDDFEIVMERVAERMLLGKKKNQKDRRILRD